MKDIYELYSQHTSIKLLKKLDAVEKLNKVFSDFLLWESFKNFRFKEYKGEYYETMEDVYHYTKIHLTDYTYIKEINEKIGGRHNGIKRFEDCSDKWVRYLASHLQGEELTKYLNGLQEFANKIAKSIKDEIMQPVEVEQSEYNLIDLQPQKSLIKQQIEQNNATQLEKKLEDFKEDLSEDMKDFNDNL